jgi:hypothetical protein
MVEARHLPAGQVFSHARGKPPPYQELTAQPNHLPGVAADWDLNGEKTFQARSSSFAWLGNRLQTLCSLCPLW